MTTDRQGRRGRGRYETPEGISEQDTEFLYQIREEGQEQRLEKRHASATDHADNASH